MIWLDILTKSKLLVETSSKLGFFAPKNRLAFTDLKQSFIKVSILHYFHPEYYICIKTNASSYTIVGILSQLTLDNLGR